MNLWVEKTLREKKVGSYNSSVFFIIIQASVITGQQFLDIFQGINEQLNLIYEQVQSFISLLEKENLQNQNGLLVTTQLELV